MRRVITLPKIYEEMRKSGNMSYRVHYILLGKRKVRRFPKREDAEKFQKYLETEIPKPENEWEMTVDIEELATVIKMLMRSKQVTNIDDVYACLTNNLAPNLIAHKTLTEASLEYLKIKKDEGRRDTILAKYEQVLSALAKAIGKKTPLLSDCTQKRIEQFLNAKKPGGRKYAHALLRAFFNWCINRKYIQQSPLTNIVLKKSPKKDSFNASVLHPVALKIILELVRNSPKVWYTFLILSMTGMRPHELMYTTTDPKDTLRWSDIAPHTKAIRIRREVSKTHSASTIVGTPSKLWGAIGQIPLEQFQSNDRVGLNYYHYRKVVAKLNHALSIAYEMFVAKGGVLLPTQSFTLRRDILRHSFASYSIHTIGIPATTLITRHSLQIMQTHYIGAATKEEADMYFGDVDVSEYLTYIAERMDTTIPTCNEYKHKDIRPKRLITHKD